MGQNIGIDFGTTTTEASYIDKNGFSRAINLEKNCDNIPTVLYFKSKDEYIIGNMAYKKSFAYPKACIKNFKLDFTNKNKRYEIEAENGDVFKIKPPKAAYLFLNRLIQQIQPKLLKEFKEEGTIDKAVITVPAQFNPAEKDVVKEAMTKAAQEAGFSDIRLAAEPTAAAVAFQEENGSDGETILVYDFGGGTFDVSVIKKEGNYYTEIATDGDKQLGGNNITEKIAESLWYLCCEKTDTDLPFEADEAENYSEDDYELSKDKFLLNRSEVFKTAEEIKLNLSEEDETTNFIAFYKDNENDPVLIDVNLSLDEFNDMIYEDVKKTIDLTLRVLNNTLKNNQVEKIDQIVLAGGSSQLRLVQELLQKEPKLCDLVGNAEGSSTLISRGAAVLASVELKVEEKTRFEIGTRVVSKTRFDYFEPLIPVGEKLPCEAKKRFYLFREGQSEVLIEYFEKDIKNYPKAKRISDDGINLVSTLLISGIPNQKNLALDVVFHIESDGTPSIRAEIVNEKGQIIKSDELVITKEGNLY